MKPKTIIRTVNSIVSAAALLTLSTGYSTAQTAGGGKGFSFAVYGDSRSMMYLPPGENQKEEAIKLVFDMFE